MTYYHRQILALKQALYPNDDVGVRLSAAKRFIEGYPSFKVSLAEVSVAAHFSKFHFLRLFKAYYGCTPHQYIKQERLARAKALLSAGKSLADVCDALDLDSKTSFITSFKSYCGHTPLEFQKKTKKQF